MKKSTVTLLLLLLSGLPVLLVAQTSWVSLFDGTTLKGWRTYQNKPSDAWYVQDGLLVNKGNKDPKLRHADLITEAQYENFELEFDWKIAPQANSGVMYLVTEEYASAYLSGPEYQLIDDKGYPAKLEDWQKTAANYAMDVPALDATKPAGEWNHTKIIVNKAHVEHWLNGKKVVEYELWTPIWQQHKATGKWKDAPGYGVSKKGHIALQDHGGEVWFRAIKIRVL
jgi:hypothetical protein